MEGRISLGIYDAKGKLLRVLHHEADLNEFKIGTDALVTQWDGKNDNGEDLPAGKYHARGYLVGPLKVEDLNQAAASPPENNWNASVKLNLMPNPLANDTRALVELVAGFDNDGSYLKTHDGLRLFTISESPNLSRVSIMRRAIIGRYLANRWHRFSPIPHLECGPDDGVRLRGIRIEVSCSGGLLVTP